MRVCVFAGASSGSREAHVRAARELGALLAGRGVGLVYGGGRVGLMGEVALSALEAGGEVIGVIPEALMEREIAMLDAGELRVVPTMHERKATMGDLSNAFLALPGGLGTLEELFEVWTWAQLGLHDKPIGLLDVDGFYDMLRAHLDSAAAEGFIRREFLDLLLVGSDPAELVDRLLRGLSETGSPAGRDLR